MVNPVYYYLSGKPAQFEEYLLEPERLADQWKVQARHPLSHIYTNYDNSFMIGCERVAKIVASTFLHLLSIPLKMIAERINSVYRTPIPHAVFEERKKYWDNIIVCAQSSKENVVKELIRAKIPDTKYTYIFWDIAFQQQQGEFLKRGYFAADHLFHDKTQSLKVDATGGPYLFVLQGRLGQDLEVCHNMEITEANIQAQFKEHTLEADQFNTLFSPEVVKKCHFLLAINPTSNSEKHNCLNEPQIRRLVETHLRDC